MSCIICSKDCSKYKCPVCLMPYCSVACCKTHKELPCQPPPVIEDEKQPNKTLESYQFPTEDTVPVEMLRLLDNSEGLKQCLENPHLRTLLKRVDSCDNPAAVMSECMQVPIFTEFVDEVLKVVMPQENDKQS